MKHAIESCNHSSLRRSLLVAAVITISLVTFSCATAPGGGEIREARLKTPSSLVAAATTSGSSSSGAGGFYKLPEKGPDFWSKMMTPEVAYSYRAVGGRSKCTIFVGDMINAHFDRSLYTRVFPDGLKGANDTYVDWIHNKNLVRLDPESYSIEDIQDLVDGGYLVLMAYYYPEIAGHVAFVGHSNLDLFTIPPIANLEGINGRHLDPAWFPVMVQAGTYTGITSMVYATNGWLRNDNYGTGVVRYYAVRTGS